MSTNNTIKLSSNTGDKYINPQQTLTYKGYELFGYGYLDWGRVVNQAFVNLIDQIDILKDSGLSEIQFDLEAYTEEQTRLRTQEFTTWKSGFTTLLDEKIATYISATKTQITEAITAQDLINKAIQKEVDDNFSALSEDIADITASLNQNILDVVNGQITTVLETVDALTIKVTQAQNTLALATTSLNTATTDLKHLMDSFKEEFNNAFTTFKTDTTKALQTNKEYLIEYIDSKISGTTAVTNNLEERLMSLEVLSDSLSPVLVTQLITTKVNEITEGIINDYLDDYNDRITAVEVAASKIDAKIDAKISDEIDSINQTIANQFNAYNQSLLSMGGRVTLVEKSLSPLELMRAKIYADYGSVENMLLNIMQTTKRGMSAHYWISGMGIDYKSISKNMLESLLDQNLRNTKNTLELLDSKILMLCNGLSHTAFDERSLIMDTTKVDKLKSEFYTDIKTSISDYANNDFKFMYVTTDVDNGTLDFAFKLPKSAGLSPWTIAGIEIKNTRTGEIIESDFYVTDTINAPFVLDYFGATAIEGLIPLESINGFRYSLALNVSETVYAQFNNPILITDTFEFKFYKTSNHIASNLILTKQVVLNSVDLYKIDSAWINSTYADLYKVDYTIGKDALTPTDASFTLNNTKVILPVCKLGLRQDGSKEFLIKVKLPTGATLTSIVYNDGYSTQTKTFVNRPKLPLSKAEYDATNQSTTENYYQDICSTGVLDYQINTNAKKVTGTVTYKIGTTTKTMDFNTGGSGGSGGSGGTVFIEHDIPSNQYFEIDTQTHFGTVDAKRSLVDVKVKDTTSTSETYNMYINGDNYSTIAIRDSRYIRIYNEFNSTLSFYIAITDR